MTGSRDSAMDKLEAEIRRSPRFALRHRGWRLRFRNYEVGCKWAAHILTGQPLTTFQTRQAVLLLAGLGFEVEGPSSKEPWARTVQGRDSGNTS